MKIKDFYSPDEISSAKYYDMGMVQVILFTNISHKKPCILINKFDSGFNQTESAYSSACGHKKSYNIDDVYGEYGRSKYKLYTLNEDMDIFADMIDFGVYEALVRNIDDIEFTPLPDHKIIIVSYKLFNDNFINGEEDTYFISVRNEFHDKYNDELYLLKYGNIIKLGINDIIRYRDGGTTIYKTDIGEVFIPSLFKQNDDVKSTFTDVDNVVHNVYKLTVDCTEYITEKLKEINVNMYKYNTNE